MFLIVPMGDDVGDDVQEPRMLSSERAELEVELRKEVRRWEKEVVKDGKLGVRMIAFRVASELNVDRVDFVEVNDVTVDGWGQEMFQVSSQLCQNVIVALVYRVQWTQKG